MQESPSKEESSSNQPYQVPQLSGFSYPFAFNGNSNNNNNNLGTVPDDLLFGNQIPDDFFQFVTDPLQPSSLTNYSTPPIVSQSQQSSPPVQQDQQQSDIFIPSPPNPSDSASLLPVQPSVSERVPTPATALDNTDTSKPSLQQRAINVSSTSSSAPTMGGKKRKHELTLGEPVNQSVYTVIVGGKTFRLSWESLKSDGPTNFFVNYFRRQRNTRVMYVDRDGDIFQLIVHHLRGYYVRPVDDIQNQDLLNDARYYGLQRLYKTLQEFLFVNVGGRVFRLSWDLLRKGKTKQATIVCGKITKTTMGEG
jgi:hypothetical protein